jgi:hypothetical protein
MHRNMARLRQAGRIRRPAILAAASFGGHMDMI